MNKKVVGVTVGLMILLSLTGCQLAKTQQAQGQSKDRLIGVLITDQFLDLMNEKDGRLYASLREGEPEKSEKEYVFDDIEGICFSAPEILSDDGNVYVASTGSEYLSESHLDIYNSDDEDKMTLTAVIYLLPGAITRYLNPVYQSGDKSVYVVAGDGISMAGVWPNGGAYSQNIQESVTFTENGVSRTKTTDIDITLEVRQAPEKIVVIQMDQNSEVVSRQEYEPGKLPESLAPEEGSEYMIQESYIPGLEDEKEKVERKIVTEADMYLESYHAGSKYILVKQQTELLWK